MKNKALIYCTKGKLYLWKSEEKTCYYTNPNDYWDMQEPLNGKIVGEFECEVEEIGNAKTVNHNSMDELCCVENIRDILSKASLSIKEFAKYSNGANCYAIHIKNLIMFDKPKQLSEYYSTNPDNMRINKATPNMMYAYDNEGNEYALISIRPEWVCKIANGEKTIEVRKKVLKGMVE